MAKAKRNSKNEQEFIPEENLNSSNFIKKKEAQKLDRSPENGCSTQNSYDSTKGFKRFVEDFEIFCAAWGFYSPEVERLFDEVKKRISDGASMSEIAQLIKDILNAI